MNFRQDFNRAVRDSLNRRERAAVRNFVSFVVFYGLLIVLCIGAVLAFAQIGG